MIGAGVEDGCSISIRHKNALQLEVYTRNFGRLKASARLVRLTGKVHFAQIYFGDYRFTRHYNIASAFWYPAEEILRFPRLVAPVVLPEERAHPCD